MGPGGFAWAGGGPAPTGGEQGRGVFIQGAQKMVFSFRERKFWRRSVVMDA